MKLKTLKDIGITRKTFNKWGMVPANKKDRIYTQSEIKEEAIKWVKEHDFVGTLPKEKIDWRKVFIRFHNITEEDL